MTFPYEPWRDMAHSVRTAPASSQYVHKRTLPDNTSNWLFFINGLLFLTPYTDGKFKTISAGKFDIDSSGFSRSSNIHWFGKFIIIKSNVCVRFSDVAALVRSDMNGLQPFENTIEQTTETMPPSHKTITAAVMTTNRITNLRELTILYAETRSSFLMQNMIPCQILSPEVTAT